MTSIYQVVAVSLVIMGLAHTLARERIAEPLRRRFGGEPGTLRGYLVSCPYCISHSLALVLVPLTGTYPIVVPYELWIFDELFEWLLATVLLAVVAAFLRVVFYFVDETQGLVRRQQRVAEGEAELTRRELD